VADATALATLDDWNGMRDRTLADSAFSHLISAPIELVDIADWLFHLTSAEYQRCCPPSHIAAGATRTDDGKPMSINVEIIGESLLIQQYVAEIAGPHRCRMLSASDVFGPEGRTTCDVVWELSVEPLGATSCEYINHVTATATDAFVALLEERGIDFAEVAGAYERDSIAHNAQETPLLALSIERRAYTSR
jgi:hypothetical protein